MRFTRYTNASPVCSPTRVSLLTGLYPQRLGITKQLALPPRCAASRPSVDTLPELLRRRGYRTAHFGKWHVGDVSPGPSQPSRASRASPRCAWTPASRSATTGPRSTSPPTGRSAATAPTPAWSRATPPASCSTTRPGSFATTTGAPAGSRSSSTCGCGRLTPPTRFPTPTATGATTRTTGARSRRRTSATARTGSVPAAAQLPTLVSDIDLRIGQLLDLLDELGLDRNTVVIATGDNGGIPQRTFPANGPLRGFKGTPFEGGIRGPLVIRWPARVPPGRVTAVRVSSLDLLPTLAEAAGIPPRRSQWTAAASWPTSPPPAAPLCPPRPGGCSGRPPPATRPSRARTASGTTSRC